MTDNIDKPQLVDLISYWDYRVVHHKSETEEWFAIYEVCFSDDDKVVTFKEDPESLIEPSYEGLKRLHVTLSKAFLQPILEYQEMVDTLKELEKKVKPINWGC